MQDSVQVKITTGNHYEMLTLRDPTLYAIVSINEMPPDHHLKNDHVTHEATLRGRTFREAGSTHTLSLPNQLVALWFVLGKGSQKALGYKSTRECCWVNDRVYVRCTRNDAGIVVEGGRNRSRRGWAHRHHNGNLLVYLKPMDVLNSQEYSDEVGRALGLLMRKVVGL